MRSINNTVKMFNKEKFTWDFSGVNLPIIIEAADVDEKPDDITCLWFSGAVLFGSIRVHYEDFSVPEFGERYEVEVTLGAERAQGAVDNVSTNSRDEWWRDPQASPSLPLPLVKRLAEAAEVVLRDVTKAARYAAWSETHA